MKKVLNFIYYVFQVLWTGIKRYRADQHNQRAVALTYHTLFAIVPLAALIFGIAKGFDIETKLRLVLDERFAHHRELLKYVYDFADTTLRQASGGLVAGVGVKMSVRVSLHNPNRCCSVYSCIDIAPLMVCYRITRTCAKACRCMMRRVHMNAETKCGLRVIIVALSFENK